MILISASVCQTGLSIQSTSVSICPSCRLQSHAGRCHTLAIAPDFHTNLYFYPGTYHPGALWTEYRTRQRRKIRLTSVDAWLKTLFDMSVLIRTWRTALPAFTLHRKVYPSRWTHCSNKSLAQNGCTWWQNIRQLLIGWSISWLLVFCSAQQ